MVHTTNDEDNGDDVDDHDVDDDNDEDEDVEDVKRCDKHKIMVFYLRSPRWIRRAPRALDLLPRTVKLHHSGGASRGQI